MPYTPEMFSRYNSRIEESRNAVCRHIQYLLKPDDGYPKGSDARLKELYNIWRADCRAMDAACDEQVHLAARHEMIEMPSDDDEHFLCRQMAAVIIERYIFGQHNAEYYLPKLVEQMKVSNCWKHCYTCACHFHIRDSGWTYKNYDLLCTLSASYEEKQSELERQERLARLAEPAVGGGPLSYQPAMGGGSSAKAHIPLRVACGGWRDCTCGGCSGGGGAPLEVRTNEHVAGCACGACYNKRVANGTQDAYMAKLRAETDAILARTPRRYTGAYSPTDSSMGGARGGSSSIAGMLGAATQADNAISAARKMPGGSTEDGFAKNLFQTVQGVKYDDKCPHGLPFYACMSCSH